MSNYLSRFNHSNLVQDPFNTIVDLLTGGNDTASIVVLTLLISGTAAFSSSLIGIPLGIRVARSRFSSSIFLVTFLNTLVGIPPVILGLVLYLTFYRSGPLSFIEILFTPWIMVLSQIILTLPIVVSITRSSIADLDENAIFTIQSMGATERQINSLIFTEARQGIYIGLIAALGRALSEVGALLIVGGNIKGNTRVMTTAIVTETSKGNFDVAITLGVILLSMTFFISLIVTVYQMKTDV